MQRTCILLLLFLWVNVDFTLTQEDEAVKLDTCEVQIQQLQNKSQDQAVKLDTCEAQIQQLQKKSQDDHTLLRELRTELDLLRNKTEALEQNQTDIFNPCKFLLDPNTGSRYIHLSDDLRTVTYVGISQSYPDHQDRFTGYVQVLSSSGLRGRCYWEVDWKLEKGWVVEVAMSYRRICRGIQSECRFGQNDHSWSLTILRGGKGSVKHNSNTIGLPGKVGVSLSAVGVSSSTVGVYLDWERGALSFYDVTNGRRSHIHTFISSFTEELLPGFYVYGSGSSMSVVELNQG